MSLSGKRVTVMGLGRFGGGVGAVQFLMGQGCRVTVTDVLPADELAPALAQIDRDAVTLHLGGHKEADFRECDLVVASPAIPEGNPFLAIACQAGVPITSEMNLFWERNRGRTIVVTGSNGKSTTTSLIHAVLQAGGRRCWVGGNIGRSLLPVIDQIQPEDWVVLELSSFQLEDLAPLAPSPDVAVVTNFSPNHLDRHGTIEAYRTAKQQAVHWQRADQAAVLNQDDPDVRTWRTAGRTVWFGLQDEGREGVFRTRSGRAVFRSGKVEHEFPLRDWLALRGIHNVQNALAAACAALLAQASLADVEAGFRSFGGLPHRLETVAETDGRTFVNDSKATTPEAAALAIRAFDRPVILIAGGYDKGVDLAPMIDAAAAKPVKAVALIGATAEALAALLEAKCPHIPRTKHATLPGAVEWCVTQSSPGDVILLSPGCASYGQFRNYEERGDEFRRLAKDE